MSTSRSYSTVEPVRPVVTSHSGQWGLASMLMGSVVLILVPLFFLVLFTLFNLANDARFDESALKLASIGSMAIAFALLGLGLLGFLFGLIGLMSGVARSQPAGLSLGGILVCLAALVLAFVLMLATFRVNNELRKRVEQRGASVPSRPIMQMRVS